MKRNEMKSTSKQLQGDGIGFNKRNSQKSLTMRRTDGLQKCIKMMLLLLVVNADLDAVNVIVVIVLLLFSTKN